MRGAAGAAGVIDLEEPRDEAGAEDEADALLARMPRTLTPLDAGLATYLPATAGPGAIVIDGEPEAPSPGQAAGPVTAGTNR